MKGIAEEGGAMAAIPKPEMVLIDFDGTISPNAVSLILQSLHQFINRFTVYPIEELSGFFKRTICFPADRSMHLLFSSLGLEAELPEFYRMVTRLEEYDGTPVAIEPSFFSFLDFCDEQGIAYRVFSSAQSTVKRFSLLQERIGSQHIYDLKGRPKSSSSTFISAAEDVGFALNRCLYVDDSPLALHTAKLNGISTVMMLNEVFSLPEHGTFSSSIDLVIRSFGELTAAFGEVK